MTHSLNPEDITVVHSADEGQEAHDRSRGNFDDNDSNDSGGRDFQAFLLHQLNGPYDDTD
ncbi:hypothetical protein [Kitasatospora sp. GP82]|uniref:hypothetical protein n=1 Tax=Kitasatospora sp. GP82 TaxID=3035089 RepID=UPI002476EFAA|nr:hypothetical protein [Kitasatospora sp. GP82]MDH6123604.1 hypothetical protein [Kitasatospora sp. GP82]